MSQTGRRLAILIGSSKFEKEGLKDRPLNCPERDVDGMHELLASAELGAFHEVFVFKNSYHQAALDQIEEVLTSAARDDQVLIYYSGHGETDLRRRLYLATTNTDTKKLVATSIPVETLRTMIENSDCRKIILILDCCFGGAVGTSFVKGNVDENLKELARGYGIYILTASTAAQIAHEREGDDYGLLTKHIIVGIREGTAANDDGAISMDGLYRYVYAKVTGEGHQEPMRWALNVKGEDLIIARTSKSPIRERQRVLTEAFVEIRNNLPPSVFAKAIQAIQERRPPFYELADEFCRSRLNVGEFIEEWYRLESVERQPQPQQTEVVVAIPSDPAKPPVTIKPSPSPPAVKPQSKNVPNTGFSVKPVAKRQSPEGKTPSSLTTKVLLFWAWLFTSRRARMWIVGSAIGLPVIIVSSYLILTWPSGNVPANPLPTPSPVLVPVEVLHYRQDFEPNGFRFHFKAQSDGYIYLIVPDENGHPFPLVANHLGGELNYLPAGADFIFPASPDKPILLSKASAKFTLIFSAIKLTQLDFFSISEVRNLTSSEERALADLRNSAKAKRQTGERNGAITSLPDSDTPLAIELVAYRSAPNATSQ